MTAGPHQRVASTWALNTETFNVLGEPDDPFDPVPGEWNQREMMLSLLEL